MPSAMNGDSSVHSTSPELGSVPGLSGAQGPQTEALKQVLTVIEKKVRNMEKKKVLASWNHRVLSFFSVYV